MEVHHKAYLGIANVFALMDTMVITVRQHQDVH